MNCQSRSFVLEICANSIHSAQSAQDGGANRIELCSALVEGGITPSAGCIEQVRQSLSIGLHVLIRPRGGDFLYSCEEMNVMKKDIHVAKEQGADGVVIGCLSPDGTVDKKKTRELLEIARPMSVTFHRAFDMTPDPFRALEDICELGIDRILSSGQASRAIEGMELLVKLVHVARERIIFLIGGGVTESNLEELITWTGAHEFHTSAQIRVPSAMRYRNAKISMGGNARISEYEMAVTDVERVKWMMKIGEQTIKKAAL